MGARLPTGVLLLWSEPARQAVSAGSASLWLGIIRLGIGEEEMTAYHELDWVVDYP